MLDSSTLSTPSTSPKGKAPTVSTPNRNQEPISLPDGMSPIASPSGAQHPTSAMFDSPMSFPSPSTLTSPTADDTNATEFSFGELLNRTLTGADAEPAPTYVLQRVTTSLLEEFKANLTQSTILEQSSTSTVEEASSSTFSSQNNSILSVTLSDEQITQIAAELNKLPTGDESHLDVSSETSTGDANATLPIETDAEICLAIYEASRRDDIPGISSLLLNRLEVLVSSSIYHKFTNEEFVLLSLSYLNTAKFDCKDQQSLLLKCLTRIFSAHENKERLLKHKVANTNEYLSLFLSIAAGNKTGITPSQAQLILTLVSSLLTCLPDINDIFKDATSLQLLLPDLQSKLSQGKKGASTSKNKALSESPEYSIFLLRLAKQLLLCYVSTLNQPDVNSKIEAYLKFIRNPSIFSSYQSFLLQIEAAKLFYAPKNTLLAKSALPNKLSIDKAQTFKLDAFTPSEGTCEVNLATDGETTESLTKKLTNNPVSLVLLLNWVSTPLLVKSDTKINFSNFSSFDSLNGKKNTLSVFKAVIKAIIIAKLQNLNYKLQGVPSSEMSSQFKTDIKWAHDLISALCSRKTLLGALLNHHQRAVSRFFSSATPSSVKEIMQSAVIPLMRSIYLSEDEAVTSTSTASSKTGTDTTKTGLNDILNNLSKHCSIKSIEALADWIEENSIVAPKATSSLAFESK